MGVGMVRSGYFRLGNAERLKPINDGPNLTVSDSFQSVIESFPIRRRIPDPIVMIGIYADEVHPEEGADIPHHLRYDSDRINRVEPIPQPALASLQRALHDWIGELGATQVSVIGDIVDDAALNRPPKEGTPTEKYR
ncbi:MAG: hypothetical protein ABEI86_12630, partial [Halobacteriaceae archaeon]